MMGMEEEKLKILELRVTDLISSKQLIISILIVLVGGISGLFFIENSLPRNFLICFGIFYALILIKDFNNTNSEIRKYLYKNKKGGKNG